MTISKTARTLVASATKTAASNGTPTRSTPLGLQTCYGGVLTVKITNGGTGPATACEARVLIAHNASTPSAGSAGADWKTVYRGTGGTVASTAMEYTWIIDASAMALEVEFDGNTGQDVTIEAYFSEITGV